MRDCCRGRHTDTEMNMRVATITAAQGKMKMRLTARGESIYTCESECITQKKWEMALHNQVTA